MNSKQLENFKQRLRNSNAELEDEIKSLQRMLSDQQDLLCCLEMGAMKCPKADWYYGIFFDEQEGGV
jgi:hypothetical protein